MNISLQFFEFTWQRQREEPRRLLSPTASWGNHRESGEGGWLEGHSSAHEPPWPLKYSEMDFAGMYELRLFLQCQIWNCWGRFCVGLGSGQFSRSLIQLSLRSFATHVFYLANDHFLVSEIMGKGSWFLQYFLFLSLFLPFEISAITLQMSSNLYGLWK